MEQGDAETTRPDILIDYMGGNCPVQAEGTIDGKPFYFRARGDNWSLGIGGDPVGTPEWEHAQWFGAWPDAGWMSEEEAMQLLRFAAQKFHDQEKPGALSDDPDRAEASAKFWKETYGV